MRCQAPGVHLAEWSWSVSASLPPNGGGKSSGSCAQSLQSTLSLSLYIYIYICNAGASWAQTIKNYQDGCSNHAARKRSVFPPLGSRITDDHNNRRRRKHSRVHINNIASKSLGARPVMRTLPCDLPCRHVDVVPQRCLTPRHCVLLLGAHRCACAQKLTRSSQPRAIVATRKTFQLGNYWNHFQAEPIQSVHDSKFRNSKGSPRTRRTEMCAPSTCSTDRTARFTSKHARAVRHARHTVEALFFIFVSALVSFFIFVSALVGFDHESFSSSLRIVGCCCCTRDAQDPSRRKSSGPHLQALQGNSKCAKKQLVVRIFILGRVNK